MKRICYDYLLSNIHKVNCETLLPELKYDLLQYISSKRQVTNSTLKALCCPLIDCTISFAYNFSPSKAITLYDNQALDDYGVEAIAQNCPNLTYIRFYGTSHFPIIIHISGCTQITSPSIRKLLLSCPQVKTLAITISKFTDDDISSLILPQIENLHLRYPKYISWN